MLKVIISILFVISFAGCYSTPKDSSEQGWNNSRQPDAAKTKKIKEVVDNKPYANTKDMENILSLAKENLDTAYNSYGIFTDAVIKEKAKNTKHMDLLIQATLKLSNFHGDNGHYFHLLKVWKAHPKAFDKSYARLKLKKEQREEIDFTLKSLEASLKGDK